MLISGIVLAYHTVCISWKFCDDPKTLQSHKNLQQAMKGVTDLIKCEKVSVFFTDKYHAKPPLGSMELVHEVVCFALQLVPRSIEAFSKINGLTMRALRSRDLTLFRNGGGR